MKGLSASVVSHNIVDQRFGSIGPGCGYDAGVSPSSLDLF